MTNENMCSDPSAGTDADAPVDGATQVCPLKKSIHIDIGWTFSSGTPVADYKLILNGQFFTGTLDSGRIRIDGHLDSLTGSGELEITVTNGPIFKSPVTLDLPPLQTALGIKRRLTNLGFYAGTDDVFDDRTFWAIRAFKRAKMNTFERDKAGAEREDNTVTSAFLADLQKAYGEHPEDTMACEEIVLGTRARPATACGMFGSRVYSRNSFEVRGATDDVDPHGDGNNGHWADKSAADKEERIVGTLRLYLRAFDPTAEDSIDNRVSLPQPIRMAQFVLFELGYWIVGGAGNWKTLGGTQTRTEFEPDGDFGRHTQWAVREFQCHAKMANAAKEDVESSEQRYLPRLFRHSPTALAGIAQYPANGRVSGALNQSTRDAMEAWACGALRCPVIVYASTDNSRGNLNGSDLGRIVKENLWLYNDHTNSAPRMYAIDYSGYYTIPAPHGGDVTSSGHTFPRPIVLGEYETNSDGGPISLTPRHVWRSEHTEVRPDTTMGRGGLNGTGLTAPELSTFKVVRTAAHFECSAYFDVLNAWDDATISFGLCHWTLAVCPPGGGAPDEAREMPAFLSYLRDAHQRSYDTLFGRFGLTPERTWPFAMDNRTGTYLSRMHVQTETGSHVLCGASGTRAYRRRENRYAKNWHSLHRFQMACRVSDDMHSAMWDFARVRIRDILGKTFLISGTNRRVGDYVTSEKGVAMLLRWHIFRPAHLFRTPSAGNPNHLQNILTTVIAAHPVANDARETAMLQQINATGGPINAGITVIHGLTNVPQQGSNPSYQLNLPPVSPPPGTTPPPAQLRGTLNSFDFLQP